MHGFGTGEGQGGHAFESKVFHDEGEVNFESENTRYESTTAETRINTESSDSRKRYRSLERLARFANLKPVLEERYKSKSPPRKGKNKPLLIGKLQDFNERTFRSNESPVVNDGKKFNFSIQKKNIKKLDIASSPTAPDLRNLITLNRPRRDFYDIIDSDTLIFDGPPDYKIKSPQADEEILAYWRDSHNHRDSPQNQEVSPLKFDSPACHNRSTIVNDEELIPG